MKVLVTGSTGMVGSELSDFLSQAGYEVFRLVRRKARHDHEIAWNPAKGYIDAESLDNQGIDAAVHLAGENVFGLWSKRKKQAIYDSREKGTRLLADTLANLSRKPKVLVSASAVGYYGNRGDEVMSETSPPGAAIDRQSGRRPFFLFDPNWGADFLSRLCCAWEDATEPASRAGIRVVNLRFGVILSKQGGALSKMLLPFKLGIAGPLGGGKQYMSWIALEDVVGITHHALTTESLRGPVNAVAPNPVTNREFTRSLSRRAFMIPFLGGLANFLPAPGLGLKLALGEMANATLLSSTRAEPVRLIESGYKFIYPDLDRALKHILND